MTKHVVLCCLLGLNFIMIIDLMMSLNSKKKTYTVVNSTTLTMLTHVNCVFQSGSDYITEFFFKNLYN